MLRLCHHRRRQGLFIATAASVALAMVPAGAHGQATRAPLLGEDQPARVAQNYIVVLREGAARLEVERVARAAGGTVRHRYRRALTGFAATLPATALRNVRRDRAVKFVEADAVVRASTTQANATWGLDRIDQRSLPLDHLYNYDATGTGVTAYVIDTGIQTAHADFGGRASGGFTAIGDGNGTNDCNGHGTHVSGTIGGTTYGVAKAVRLVAVRVLGCSGSGTTSGVIAGVDWVTSDHASGRPAVANMSLGGGASAALDQAVERSIADGIAYAVAAGNESANACGSSPARVPAAITTGASTSTDARASFSNYGGCLDLFAPGSQITSAWIGSNTATNTISGTSMAAPHVAGAAALYLQRNPTATPARVRDALVDVATTGALRGVGSGSPNRLLNTAAGTGTPPPPPSGCTVAEPFSGSLAGTGDYAYHPGGTYFYTARSGTHRGCLRGPADTDFDLYLWKWNGWGWVTVAEGISASSAEDVVYAGTPGYYVWRVESASGLGAYSGGITRP